MLKKSILVIALLIVGLTVVQAQTRQQQQELEQIAMRSANGLSAQDRQRVIQIMTDVYVAQGMSRTQAAQFAEMAADTMFTSDVGEMTPEQRRQFEEQQRADQRAQQWQETPEDRRRQQLMDDYLAGRISTAEYNRRTAEADGWPTTQAMARFGTKVTRPTGNYNFTHRLNGDELKITIGKTNSQNITQAEARTLYNHFLAFGDVHRVYTGYRPPVESFINDGRATIMFQDPQRPTTPSARNMIQIEIRYEKNGGPYVTIEMSPIALHGDGTQ